MLDYPIQEHHVTIENEHKSAAKRMPLKSVNLRNNQKQNNIEYDSL